MKRHIPLNLLAIMVISALIGFGLAMLVLNSNLFSRADQRSAPALIPLSQRALAREGAPAPNFTLADFNGASVSLVDLRGRPVLINFWASWCPPCLKETPALIEAYEALIREGRQVAFVGIGTSDESENLRRFAREYAIPYIVLEDLDGKVSDAYGVRGMPTTFFVDSNGIVRRIWNGELRKEQVLQFMRELR